MKKILVFLSSIMISLSLIACGGTETTDSNSINIEEEMEFSEFQWPENEPEDTSSDSVEDIIIDDNTSKNAEDTTELSEADTVEETEELVDGMRPEFKDAMDSYEAFFDEYCEFMKKYSESTDTLEMLTDYTEYLTKYADTMIKLDEIENGDMTDAELKYYTEVMGRINQKLASVKI